MGGSLAHHVPNRAASLHCVTLRAESGSRAVQPGIQLITHSAHGGFRLPPACTFSAAVLRFSCDGPLLFAASCPVGVETLTETVWATVHPTGVLVEGMATERARLFDRTA